MRVSLLLIFLSTLLLSSCDFFEEDGSDSPEIVTQDALFPVFLNGKWGFIDAMGRLRVEPQFDEAKTSSNGMAAFRQGRNWGFISVQNPSQRIAASFDFVGDFSQEGLALARAEGGQYGYINASGEWTISPTFELATSFTEGLAAVRQDGLWGYIDQTGTQVIDFAYSSAGTFAEGLAAVEGPNGWEYINQQGNSAIRLSFQISFAGTFAEGLAPIQTTEGWGYINTAGALVIPIQFEQAESFSLGYAQVMDDNRFGYINATGELAVEYQFDEARPFRESAAAVRLGNRWFFVDASNGKLVRTPAFHGVEDFQQGLALVWFDQDQNQRFAYIDPTGEYVWHPTR